MESYHFKTNLKCNGCINAIRPVLENMPEIKEWNADLTSPDRILHIEATSDVTESVIEGIKKAGYEITRL